MRTMKDTERLMIIIRVYLHLHGPATAKEITDYVNNCPVNLLTFISPSKIGTLLRGKRGIKRIRKNKKHPQKYWVEV